MAFSQKTQLHQCYVCKQQAVCRWVRCFVEETEAYAAFSFEDAVCTLCIVEQAAAEYGEPAVYTLAA